MALLEILEHHLLQVLVEIVGEQRLAQQVGGGAVVVLPARLVAQVAAETGVAMGMTERQVLRRWTFARGWLRQTFGEETGDQIRVLYGGSVKPANVAELMSMPDIDGALVGGASLAPETFSQIVKF